MNKPKHNWPEIEADILAGMTDREVSDKYNVPYVTVQHHRYRNMGIISEKTKKAMANHALRETEPIAHTPNMHISMTKEQIINRNMAVMSHHMSREHFQIWKQNQGNGSDWRAFL